MKGRASRLGLSLIEVLVVIAIVALLLGLLLPAVQRLRDAGHRSACKNNLRQIGLAFHHYHETQRAFPPGVSYRNGADPFPFMSWNTRLLPYLDQEELWHRAVQAFARDRLFLNNPPHGGLSTVVKLYSCPADGRTRVPRALSPSLTVAFTSYLGVSGADPLKLDGLLYLDSSTHFSDILDGTSHTVLVGERPPSADGLLGWWYAGEGQVQDGSGDMVLSVRERNTGAYGPGCPPGPYVFGPGRASDQCSAFHFWSPHSGGGAHFLFADGSVHFLPYSANPILPALATRAGGDVVPDFE